jgi:hypothetical protein
MIYLNENRLFRIELHENTYNIFNFNKIYSCNILLFHCILKNSPLFHMFHKNIQRMTSLRKLNAIDAIVMKDM